MIQAKLNDKGSVEIKVTRKYVKRERLDALIKKYQSRMDADEMNGETSSRSVNWEIISDLKTL